MARFENYIDEEDFDVFGLGDPRQIQELQVSKIASWLSVLTSKCDQSIYVNIDTECVRFCPISRVVTATLESHRSLDKTLLSYH